MEPIPLKAIAEEDKDYIAMQDNTVFPRLHIPIYAPTQKSSLPDALGI